MLENLLYVNLLHVLFRCTVIGKDEKLTTTNFLDRRNGVCFMSHGGAAFCLLPRGHFFFRRHLSLSCQICSFLGLLIPHVTVALQSCISRWLVEACLYLIMSVPKLVISRLISSYLRWSQELNWVYLHLLVLSCLLGYVICAVWSAASVKTPAASSETSWTNTFF